MCYFQIGGHRISGVHLSEIYATKVAVENAVLIIPTTTASGHGKYIHDQIGGGFNSKATHGHRNDLIRILAGETIAAATIRYLQESYSSSISGSINRYFFEIKPTEIAVRESPVKSLEIVRWSKKKCIIKKRFKVTAKFVFEFIASDASFQITTFFLFSGIVLNVFTASWTSPILA